MKEVDIPNLFFIEYPALIDETDLSICSQYSPRNVSSSQTQPIGPGPQEPLPLHVIPFFSHMTTTMSRIRIAQHVR